MSRATDFHPTDARPSSQPVRRTAWLLGILSFALYAATASPSITALFDDSLEFQVVLPSFQIAHPTGYPLYTLLGGLWNALLAALNIGNPAYRINLFSALAGAAAVAFTFLAAHRLTRHVHNFYDPRTPLWPAVVASVLFALGTTWWSQSTIAEVYALHGLFVASILYVAFDLGADSRYFSPNFLPSKAFRAAGRKWVSSFAGHRHWWLKPTSLPGENRLKPVGAGRANSLSAQSFIPPCTSPVLLCLLLGLALAHHRTTVLLLPGLALYLLWAAPALRRPSWLWLRCGIALAAPLLLYAYLPIRATMGATDLNASYVNTWPGFWNHTLALGYGGYFGDVVAGQAVAVPDYCAPPASVTGGGPTLPRAGDGWAGTLDFLRREVGVLGLVLAGAAGFLARSGRREIALVALVGLTNWGFALVYGVTDVEVFLLPVVLCLCLLVAAGLAALNRTPRPRWQNAAFVALLLVPLLPNAATTAQARLDKWLAHDYAVAITTVDFAPGSFVTGLEGEATALRYMQGALNVPNPATPVAADNPDVRRDLVRRLVDAGQPVYLTRELSGLAGDYSFSGHGPLVRVWPRGQANPSPPATSLDVTFDDGALRLVGYDLDVLQQAGGDALRVALYWRPVEPLAQRLKLSLRVLDSTGRSLLWEDDSGGGTPVVADSFPLRQLAPTTTWLVGERVRDVQCVALPPREGEESQSLRLQVIVYDEQTVVEVGRWEVEFAR